MRIVANISYGVGVSVLNLLKVVFKSLFLANIHFVCPKCRESGGTGLGLSPKKNFTPFLMYFLAL